MANAKVSDYITKVRQWSSQYAVLMTEADGLINQWSALYTTLVTDDEFVGENSAVIPNPTKTVSLTSVIANMQTILSAYDNGIDSNVERVK